MNTSSLNKPSIGFWIASITGLLWNLMGVSAYIQQAYKVESYRAQIPVELLEIMDNSPAWATAAFAIAVFAATFGCIALIFRKKIAKPLFILSLISVVVQFSHEFFMTNARDYYDTFGWVMTIMIPIVSIYLIWVSKKAISKNWIS